jgi:hypothetical protein
MTMANDLALLEAAGVKIHRWERRLTLRAPAEDA